MENNLWHCSTCNHISKSNRDLNDCPQCGGKYVHIADNSCISISYKEHGGKIALPENSTTLVGPVPDATGYSNGEYDSGAVFEFTDEDS